MKNFEFLKSVRFWKLVVIAVLVVLQQEGFIPDGLADALARVLEFVLGGSVVVRTVDRFAEKLSARV